MAQTQPISRPSSSSSSTEYRSVHHFLILACSSGSGGFASRRHILQTGSSPRERHPRATRADNSKPPPHDAQMSACGASTVTQTVCLPNLL